MTGRIKIPAVVIGPVMLLILIFTGINIVITILSYEPRGTFLANAMPANNSTTNAGNATNSSNITHINATNSENNVTTTAAGSSGHIYRGGAAAGSGGE
jgi:hypothetical protein